MTQLTAPGPPQSSESQPARRPPFLPNPNGSHPLNVRSILTDLSAYWIHGRTVERIAYAVGALLFLSGLFHLGVHLVDGGSWLGPVSFRKAFSFGTSFGLTLITLAWVQTHLRIGEVFRAILLGSFTLVSLTEVFGATVQPWRGQASHFNQEGGAFNDFVNDIMAGGALIILVTVAAYSLYSLRRMQTNMRMSVAIRYGFGVLWVAMILGIVMSTLAGAAISQGDAEAAYAVGEGYKPGHAAAMHAILIVPGLAWLLDRTGLPERTRMRYLLAGIGLYTLAAATFALVF